MAASVKASFGPFAFVGEINSATKPARFFDALGILTDIQPMAWQVALAYQFDWNPWVTEIGAQGDFISVVYTGSKDMAGVTNLINGATAIGFIPQHAIYASRGRVGDGRIEAGTGVSSQVGLSGEPAVRGGLRTGYLALVQLNF